jgi:tetratricopeptide (TPR) repeat protein
MASATEECIRERAGTALGAVSGRVILAWSLAEHGALVESLACSEATVRIAEAVGLPIDRSLALWGIGKVYLRKGDLTQALAALERRRTFSEAIGLTLVDPEPASLLGYAYVLVGQLADGVALQEGALTRAETLRIGFGHTLMVMLLAESRLLAGRHADASALATRSLGLARQREERGHEAWALRLLGEVAADLGRGDVEMADAYYREALAVGELLEMRLLIAHCHLGLGKLCRRTGDGAKAQEHLTTAATMYRAMDMSFYLAQAEAAGAGGNP